MKGKKTRNALVWALAMVAVGAVLLAGVRDWKTEQKQRTLSFITGLSTSTDSIETISYYITKESGFDSWILEVQVDSLNTDSLAVDFISVSFWTQLFGVQHTLATITDASNPFVVRYAVEKGDDTLVKEGFGFNLTVLDSAHLGADTVTVTYRYKMLLK